MKSMTGHGRATRDANDTRVAVELASVNRKQLDLRFVLPRELGSLEYGLRDWLQARISRGAVSVTVEYALGVEKLASVRRVNRELARQTAAELTEVADAAGIEAPVTVQDVLSVPGVLLETPSELPMDILRPLAMDALDAAFREFDAMRTTEGGTLVADIAARAETMQSALEQVRQAAAGSPDAFRRRLQQRAAELGLALDSGDERLVKEAVFLADRSDVTEELVRLQSHFAQLDAMLGASEPQGRSLEFLCQEMHREVNTLASKTRGTGISDAMVLLKSELGRIKEQAMNLE